MLLEEGVDLTIIILSNRLNLSVRQVQRIMKSHYDCNFSQLKVKYKLANACECLKNSKDSLLLIAEKCGFSSADYFTYCFKKEYHMKPSQYRKG